MSSYFQYTPAAYSPSTPSPTGRLDTTWSGGIGTLDVGRIPIQGGAKRRSYKRSHKRSQKRQRKQQYKKTQRKQRK